MADVAATVDAAEPFAEALAAVDQQVEVDRVAQADQVATPDPAVVVDPVVAADQVAEAASTVVAEVSTVVVDMAAAAVTANPSEIQSGGAQQLRALFHPYLRPCSKNYPRRCFCHCLFYVVLLSGYAVILRVFVVILSGAKDPGILSLPLLFSVLKSVSSAQICSMPSVLGQLLKAP